MGRREARLPGIAVALAMFVAVLAACGGSADTEQAGVSTSPPDVTMAATPEMTTGVDETSASRADTKQVPIEVSANPIVELVQAGSHPREPLRLAVKPGEESRAVMTMTMTQRMTVDGQQVPAVSTPPIHMPMAVTIEDVTDDRITSTFGYGDIEVQDDGTSPEEVVATLRQQLAGLEHVTGRIVATDRGEFVSGSLDRPTNLSPALGSVLDQMGQQMGSMMLPTPTEPVGEGAEWTVSTTSGMGGFETDIVARYRVVERDGSRIRTEVDITQKSATMDAVDVPGMPPGAELEIIRFDGSGGGHTTIDLSRLFPVDSVIESIVDADMLVRQGGQQSRLEQHIEMRMSIAAVD